MQSVIIVAGDDVTGSSLQEIFQALANPGILNGFQLSVGADQVSVQVSPGSGLLDSGVFIFEDNPTGVNTGPLSLSGGPQDFTVLYLYTPTNVLGGTPAVLTVQAGLVDPDTLVGGLVLGWIVHSGGTTLSPADFIPGRMIKLAVPNEKLKNNFTMGQILLQFAISGTANMIVSFIDTAGNTYSPGLPWTFIGQAMAQNILSIPQNIALTPGGTAYISLSMTFQAGAFVNFQTIGYSSYTEPF
jgi:hypothetical protein